MDWKCITALLVLLNVVNPSFAVGTSARIHMQGVKGMATFSLSGSTLTVSLNVDQALGSTNVEIRPFWMNYDVADKCSEANLGPVEDGRRRTVTINANTRVSVTFSNVDSLNSIEGHSIVLVSTSPSKTICAGIWKEGPYVTAVARFRGPVLGSVYFRQHNASGSVTRIITDLYTQANFASGTWRITDGVGSCSMYTSKDFKGEAWMYNPTHSKSQGCGLDQQYSCPQGDLSGKNGNVHFGKKSGGNKRAYTDQNLFLFGDNRIENKQIIIFPVGGSDTKICADIYYLQSRKARADFAHNGVRGYLEFTQISPLDSTGVTVSLQNLRNVAGGYHVHLWPKPVQTMPNQTLCDDIAVSGHLNPYGLVTTDPSYPGQGASTDDMYEVGDLSGKYGRIDDTNTQVYNDWNLPLYGSNNIIGRSLVIHKNDAKKSRWICSNIEPMFEVVTAVATFHYPIFGKVFFMQASNDPLADTAIFAELDNSDGLTGTFGHQWEVRENWVSTDVLSEDPTKRCNSTGGVYNPEGLWEGWSDRQYIEYCQANKMSACKMGDLGRRLGTLAIRNSGSSSSDKKRKAFFTDTNLPINTMESNSIMRRRRSLVIMNEAGNEVLACADIEWKRPAQLTTRISVPGTSGFVVLSEKSGIGAKFTTVYNYLTGLSSNYKLRIHDLPPLAQDDSCSDLGEIFDPFNLGSMTSSASTDDEFRVGDLDRKGVTNEWQSSNLPISGLSSVQGRSLVVVDTSQQNERIVTCGAIEVRTVADGSSHLAESWANFTVTDNIKGTVHLKEVLYFDGTRSDTSILISVSHGNNQITRSHNWHVHVNSVRGDANAETGRCSSAGPHYDPYLAMKSNKDVYPSECSKANPERCELGDLSNKLGTYDIGGGRKLFIDDNLPLGGFTSVNGRSLVFHSQNRGAARIACVDIIPRSGATYDVTFKTPETLDLRQVAQAYADAIEAPAFDIVVEVLSQRNGVTEARVHFVGLAPYERRQKFVNLVNNDKEKLGPYQPHNQPDTASSSAVSGLLFAFIALLHILLLR